MNFRLPKGVFDILPTRMLSDSKDLWQGSELWQFVESIIRQTCREYGFHEVRTPMFEQTDLFCRGVGQTSDIVTKEMYTFDDKGNRSMTLRPEGTASVMRAYLSNKLHGAAPMHKLFYVAPMFRYERPQAGRYRQHHQFGVEAIGSDAPEQDVEVIDLLMTFLRRVGLSDLTLAINTIGTPEDRAAFRQALIDYLTPQREHLSEDSQHRLDTNPLRILDSKDERDRKITANAPSILDHLSSESADHFAEVQTLLIRLGISFKVEPKLVRGLDYYNKTVFEVVSGQLGAQDSVGGGGRYDGLIKTLGGPDSPAIGFGSGIERILQTLLKQHPDRTFNQSPTFFFIPLGDMARHACFSLTHEMRQHGVSTQMEFSKRKLKKVMSYAHSIGAKYTAVVGDEEIHSGKFKMRDMESGEEHTVDTHFAPFELLYLAAKSDPVIAERLAEYIAQGADQSVLKDRKISILQ